MYNEIHLRFISKKNNIAVVRNMIGAMLVDNNPTITFLNEIKTVISEAITNCIVHAYSNQEDKFIDMNVIVNDALVRIEVEDQGLGIEDIDKAREPLFSTKADDERSGLGFTIMEMFCDSLEVISHPGKGTKLYLEKNW